MRPLRASLVLAILAALLGAPSIASAASNSLRGASVSPTSGSVATVFTFTVTYDGHFAATSMTVAAGGAVLPMTRTGGTAEAGTWSGSGMLPAGTWVPVFTASVEQGADAVLAGPTVTVSGLGMPPASSPPSGGGGSTPDGGQIEPTDPGSLSTPYPAPAVSSPASPVPGSAIQTPGPTDAPTGGSAPRDGSGSDGGGGGGGPAPGIGSTGIGSAGAGSSGGGSHDGPSTGASGGSDDDGSSGGSDDHPGAAPADRSTQPEATAGAGWFVPAADERDDDESDTGLGGDGLSSDGVVEVVLLIALSGVAAVALAGTALLMTGRRRAGGDAERAAEAARTEAVLHERMLRRARVRLDDDDPIVAAIGDDEARHRSERGTPRPRPPES